MATASFSKMDLARIQLERAIALYLDQQDFVSSITLARAAHELVRGAVAQQTGKPSAQVDEFADLVSQMTPFEEQATVKKGIIKRTFFFANQLKHHDSNDPMVLAADWRSEAYDLVILTIDAWFHHHQTLTDEMTRFENQRSA